MQNAHTEISQPLRHSMSPKGQTALLITIILHQEKIMTYDKDHAVRLVADVTMLMKNVKTRLNIFRST